MPTPGPIPFRNLRYHWQANLAVLLGVAVAAAVLTGALLVGDSLRGSLRAKAEAQLRGVRSSWVGARLIDAGVASKLPPGTVPALTLQGSLGAANTPESRLPRATVYALDSAAGLRFDLPEVPGWAEGKAVIVLSAAAGEKLGTKAGDVVELSVQKFSAVPRGSLLGRRAADDVTANLKLTVAAVLPSNHPANAFGLTPSPAPPVNVFCPLAYLQGRLGQPGKINALFAFDADAPAANVALASALSPADVGLRVLAPKARGAYVSVESEQLVLEPAAAAAAVSAAKALGMSVEPTTIYLANGISDGASTIPYSIVAGLNPAATAPLGPFLPPGVAGLKDDEIVLADWPASPLAKTPAKAKITLTFFQPEMEAGAVETTAAFTLVGRVPLAGVAADPDLTPPFPGVTDKASIRTWDPPFPFDNSRIKPNDVNEQFWNKYRTTPKAYVTRAAADKLFGSRFGTATSVRIAPTAGETPADAADRVRTEFAKQLTPGRLGIAFEPTRERMLAASGGSNDFAGLFLGFSFFLVVSSLLLVGLLFRLNVERRAKEVGVLLAVGFAPGRVRRILLAEGLIVAAAGAVVGLALGVAYSRFLLYVLVETWPDDSIRTLLQPHARPATFAIAFFMTLIMCGGAIAFALRGLTRVPPPALLRGVTWPPEVLAAVPTRRSWILPILLIFLGGGLLAVGGGIQNPDARAGSFFGGGGLLLAAGLLAVRRWLRRESGAMTSSRGAAAMLALGPRNAGRFPGRSLLTVALLAAATFLLVAVESFRRTPDADFNDRTGGSGGFNLIAEVDVPLFETFDKEPGRGAIVDSLRRAYQSSGPGAEMRANANALQLNAATKVVPLRLRDGDDASCLNLYQAGKPRVLGVPDALIDRGGFRFNQTQNPDAAEKANPWLLLRRNIRDGVIPVIVEQNTAMWMLKKGVGDTIDIADDAGNTRQGVIVATLQDSVFQSEILVPDAAFRDLYPRDEGFRMLLVETIRNEGTAVGAILQTGYRANGLVATPSRDRVAGYQAVVGSYLTTFQLLGGMGLLLGVCGVSVLILRGVWERVGELALLRAFGYTPGAVRLLVLGENLFLLSLGLGVGFLAAVASVAPHAAAGGVVPWGVAAALAAGVFAVGAVVVLVTTAGAARVAVVPALRKE